MEQLRAEPTNRDRSVWLDTSDIAPTSVWRQDIVQAALEPAATVPYMTLCPGLPIPT